LSSGTLQKSRGHSGQDSDFVEQHPGARSSRQAAGLQATRGLLLHPAWATSWAAISRCFRRHLQWHRPAARARRPPGREEAAAAQLDQQLPRFAAMPLTSLRCLRRPPPGRRLRARAEHALCPVRSPGGVPAQRPARGQPGQASSSWRSGTVTAAVRGSWWRPWPVPPGHGSTGALGSGQQPPQRVSIQRSPGSRRPWRPGGA